MSIQTDSTMVLQYASPLFFDADALFELNLDPGGVTGAAVAARAVWHDMGAVDASACESMYTHMFRVRF